MAALEQHHFEFDPSPSLKYERENDGDPCTREGAEKLAHSIETYWAKRGKTVKIKFVEAGFIATIRSTRVDLRSDMKNGMPAAD